MLSIRKFSFIGGIIFATGLVMLFISCCMVGFNFKAYGLNQDNVIDRSGTYDNVSNINIQASLSKIHIIGSSEAKKINVSWSDSESIYFDIVESEDMLDIKQIGYNATKYSFKYMFTTTMPEFELTLTLPMNTYSSLKVSNTTGDILIEQIVCDDIIVNSVVSEIDLVSINNDKLTVFNQTGDINLKKGLLEDASLGTIDGDIKIGDTEAITLDVSTDTGSVSLVNLTAIKLVVTMGTGDLSTTTIKSLEIDIKITTGDCNITLFGSESLYLITIKCKLGNSNIDNTLTGTRTLNISLTMGDAIVNFTE